MRGWPRRGSASRGLTWLAAGVAILLVWTVLYPNLFVVLDSFRGEAGATLEHYRRFFDSRSEMEAVWNSVWLSLASVVCAGLIGVPLAFLFARGDFPGRRVLSGLVSLPVLLPPLVWLFALQLGWLPASGMESLRSPSSGLGRALDVGSHLLLPMIALSFRYLALVTRVTRTSMQESLAADFITTARAKGLLRRTVVYRHGLRNALIPVVTVVGYEMGFALSGSVLVETVFGWPGVGRLLYDAILSRDTPLILGLFVVLSVTVVAVNFVTDMVYSILDPRVSYGAKARA